MSDTVRRIASLSPEKLDLLMQAARKRDAAHEPTIIQPQKRQGQSFPLSFAQQRLWFLDQWEPSSPFYNIPAALQLKGQLDLEALKQTLNEIVQRHETLRTTIELVEGQPVQHIHDRHTVDVPLTDLLHLSPADREVVARQMVVEEAELPFDLKRGPLLRVRLLRLFPDEHHLLLTMHHIVSDGWSIGIFLHELTTLYTACTTGQPSSLAPLPVQYTDFALWQRQWLQGEALQAHLAYWQQQLQGIPDMLALPTDRPRPAVQTFSGTQVSFPLPTSLTAALKSLSQREGVTLFMTLLAAFDILLLRYSGQDDIVVGTPIANRTHSQIEGLIGFFVNTLVLRTKLADNPSFSQVLHQVQRLTLQAYEHQDVPFERLVEALEPERALSHTPLFQVMFALQNLPTTDVALPGLSITPLTVDSGTSRFDLTVVLVETEQGLQIGVEYNTDLFDSSTIARLVAHYQTLLTSIVSNPHQRVWDLPLLTEQERQMVQEWNDTQRTYPSAVTLHGLVEVQAVKTPDAIAVSIADEQISYGELHRRATQIASLLHQKGIGPEHAVGICLERSVEMVVGLLGILKAGAAYVPLDPALPPERLRGMLDDAHIIVVLTLRSHLAQLPAITAQVYCLDEKQDEHILSGSANSELQVQPEQMAYIIYTSGSTGRPKGVMVSHRSICNRLLWMQETYQLTPGDHVLQKTPLSFDVSVWEVFWPLLTGARLVLARPEGQQDSRYLAQLLQEQAISTLHFVPSMLSVFLQEPGLEKCTGLSRVICSGEALPWEVQQRFFASLPEVVELHNLYGPTEAAVDVTWWACPREDERQSVPIGRPIANIELYVLDRYGNHVPVGVAGELHIGGVGLARGYVGQADLTAERFIPHAFSSVPGARLYRTGDLARYRANGVIEFLGRIDHQVKLRGFRIELGEIEVTLSQHPNVQDAVVVVREDRPGDQRLVAYVTSRADQTTSNAELRQYLKQQLPEYMLPSSFVWLDSMPLTPNGKVNRKALPQPDVEDSRTGKADGLPASPLEEILAAIWTTVLGNRHVGRHDNFFELGGHSLLATQVVSRIRTDLQVELPLRSFFEAPTVAGLAELVEKARQPEQTFQMPVIRPCARDENPPLSFAQQRLWFLDQWEPDNASYNLPVNLRLSGPLDRRALEQSINEIVRRHEALRTTFALVDSQPAQIIAPALPVSLPLVDLIELPVTERENEVQRLATREVQRPFSLEQGPLIHTALLRCDETEHVLLLTMHHIVFDGWSTEVFLHELATLYAAFSSNQPSPLPALPIQYADYAVWQREWLQGDVLDAQLAYWKRQLDGMPTMLEVSTDRPRPLIQSYQGKHFLFSLPVSLAKAVKQLCQREGVTLFMLLLATYQTLLYRYTGQEDICTGTPIANRMRSEVEQLIGFFVNTLVLRTDVSGNPTFHDLLERVREVALGAYAHQDLPFEQLVDALQPERSPNHNPLFQVMFAVQNAPKTSTELAGLSTSFLQFHTGLAKFDLFLLMIEAGEELGGVLEYNTDIFDEATIVRMVSHYQTLLESIVTDVKQPLSDLSMLTESERRQIVSEWNDSGRENPWNQSFSELFEAQVMRSPDSLAVVCEGQKLTYRDLNQKANQLARQLHAMGVGPEVLVAVLDGRGINLLLALLAIFKAGGTYLPLDPTHPALRIRQVLERSGCSIVLAASAFTDTLRDALAGIASHSRPQVLSLEEILLRSRNEHGENLLAGSTPHQLAYVIYTSGSTGVPKGAMVEQQGMINHLYAKIHALNLTASDRVAQTASQCFDISIWQFLVALLSGGQVEIFKDDVSHDALHLLRQVDQQHVSILETVPSMLRVMLEAIERGDIVRPDLTSLRWLVPTGEALPPELCQRWFAVYPDIPLLNAYGPTECSDDVTHYPIYQSLAPTVVHTPIGRPVENMQLYILDQKLQPLPVGVSGELYVGGIGVGRGYLDDPQHTAAVFVPNVFSHMPGQRLYKTGDLARYLPDGTIEFLGRADYQVKIRGYRIELGEIEAALGQHSGVRDRIVLVREDSPGDKRLVAYVVPSSETAFSVHDVRSYLEERLPDYMLPAFFVPLEALPLTPNGKVNRHALPPPATKSTESEQVFVAPRNAVEKILADIWCQVLGLQQVSIHDNFFHVGGDSILSLQIISRVHRAGLQLTPKQLFQHQTIAQLANVVSEATITQAEQGPVVGSVPLTPIQHWFFEQQLANPHHWNQAMFMKVSQPLDTHLLEMSIKHLLFHHDALRLRFFRRNNHWEQFNAEPNSIVPFRKVDLSGFTEAGQDSMMATISDETQASLNLSEGPILKAVLFHNGQIQPDCLLLVVHHLAIDGVSWRLLLDDLQVVYQQLSQSKMPQLPFRTTSFQQWSLRLQEYAQSEALHRELSYWLDEKRKRSNCLPQDYPGNTNTEASVQTITTQLSAEETQALLQEVPKAYHTQINDLLLTALVQTFGKWIGSYSLLVNLEGHGREDIWEDIDLSRTVGWFTTITPVLLDLEGHDEAGDSLKTIKEQLRGIPNRGIGYGLLRYLCEDRDSAMSLQALPQAEVCFNYLGQFDQIISDSSLFGRLLGGGGMPHSPHAQRSYLLEINGIIINGMLQMEWVYSQNLYACSTIAGLAQNCLDAIRSLIAHCQSAEAGGYTPSDFPDARLSSEKLDELLATLDALEENENEQE